jgi:hypothetical protein
MNESLVKYLAGLADADGSLSFMFSPPRPGSEVFYASLMFNIASSDVVDTHGFINSLPQVTGFGSVYALPKKCKAWSVTKRSDLEMLLPRLIKHMVVKGKHWQWLLDTRRQQRGVPLTKQQCEQLSIASKKSRAENVGPIKPKNHPSWAWLAGYIDGDGHFCYRNRNRNGCLNINVGATAHRNDAAIVFPFIQKAVGGRIYEDSTAPNVQRWRRNLGPAEADFVLGFLPKLARHSRFKRHHIDHILHLTRQQRLSVSAPAGEAIV